MTFPRVLLLIVTWNKKKDVLKLLHSVMEQDYPRESFQITLIDNDSQDGTAQAVAHSYPEVHILRNPENLGGSGGFNTGLARAFRQPEGKFSYLWLLDNDVIVHRQALSRLVALLEEQKNAAIAGSAMMQSGAPWKLHEMGAFFDPQYGRLILNRHGEEVLSWKEKSLESLRTAEPDICYRLANCPPFCHVDYTAAASLLIRSDIAASAGLWRNYFIHFDDVEWCLRIARMGYGILASAESLIWHASSSAKVPAQVLYYDKRNVLDLLRVHYGDEKIIARIIRRTRLKALYFALIGRADLSFLYRQAIQDFRKNRLGKRNDIPPDEGETGIWQEIREGLKEWMRD